MDAQRFVKLRSIHTILFPSEKQQCVYCGNFITYSWFNISSKCTDLSGLFTGEGGWCCCGLCSADSFNCLMVFFSLAHVCFPLYFIGFFCTFSGLQSCII